MHQHDNVHHNLYSLNHNQDHGVFKYSYHDDYIHNDFVEHDNIYLDHDKYNDADPGKLLPARSR